MNISLRLFCLNLLQECLRQLIYNMSVLYKMYMSSVYLIKQFIVYLCILFGILKI